MRYLVVLLASGCSFRAGLAPGDGPAVAPHDTSVDSPIAIDAAPDAEMIDAPIDAPKGIHFVQGSASVTTPWGTSSETLAMTFGSDVAIGDLIAVYFSYDDTSGNSIDKITDSAGDGYTVVETNAGDHGQASAAAWAIATQSGPLTITGATNDSDCCLVLLAHEVAGVDASNPVDAHHGHSQNSVGGGPDNVTSDSFTGHVGDYLFGGTTDPSNTDMPTIAAGTGFTARLDVDTTATNANAAATEDMIQTAGGSTATTFTFSNGEAITIAIAFSPAS